MAADRKTSQLISNTERFQPHITPVPARLAGKVALITGGAKGIGELPMDGPAPAIINALENATGISFNQIPLMPENVMAKAAS